MQMVTYLLIGILIGWGIEWVIDWIFWRRVRESPTHATSAQYITSASAVPDNIVPDDGPIEDIAQDMALLQAELEEAHRGTRLLEKNLVDSQNGGAILHQELEATQGKMTKLQDTLDRVEQENRERLQELSETQAEILQLKLKLEEAKAANEGDVLQRINGIGPTYAQRLNAAGIRRFSQIADSTVERVTEIIGPKGWQTLDISGWIEEAKLLAFEDDLESIDGVTPVYKRILNQSRVYTFTQLAELTPAQIQEWIPSEEGVELDLAAWIAQSKAFSEQ